MNEIVKDIDKQESERFQALFQYASMGILVADSEGSILMANNFLLSQFGYDDPLELKGKKIEVVPTLVPDRLGLDSIYTG